MGECRAAVVGEIGIEDRVDIQRATAAVTHDITIVPVNDSYGRSSITYEVVVRCVNDAADVRSYRRTVACHNRIAERKRAIVGDPPAGSISSTGSVSCNRAVDHSGGARNVIINPPPENITREISTDSAVGDRQDSGTTKIPDSPTPNARIAGNRRVSDRQRSLVGHATAKTVRTRVIRNDGRQNLSRDSTLHTDACSISVTAVTPSDGHATESKVGRRADIKNPIVQSPGTTGIDDSLIGTIADDRDLGCDIEIA